MPPDPETIAAIATPPGRGGIGIVRISGGLVHTIAQAVLGRLPNARTAVLAKFLGKSGDEIDQGIALYYPAPHSYTGEEVLELQGHGGPVVMDMLLQRITDLGARLAGPGEFSERAFLNGKLDLAQAEAVADLIDSGSEAAARSALRSLQGAFSQKIHGIVDAVTRLRMYVEAAIDFPEEEVDFLGDERLLEQLERIEIDLDNVLSSAQQGRLLRDGLQLVLVGRPNAGKSSILNALCGTDRAIVSTSPGTTRDTIEQAIQIDGLPIHLVDTAGLRDSGDEVEQLGVARTHRAMTHADQVMWIIDDSEPGDLKELETVSVPEALIKVYNKIDLTGRPSGEVPGEANTLAVSARTGAGIDALRLMLKQFAGYQEPDKSTFIARRRHLEALSRARSALAAAKQQLRDARAGEVVAEELRQVQKCLGEITGEVHADDLLGRIFADFCIGK